MTETHNIAIIGGGVIGGGWAARFLLNGHDVTIFDPASDAETKINAVIKNAKHSLPALYDTALPETGTLIFAETLQQAVENADWIQESVPEQLELKQKIYGDIQKFAKKTAIIASSTSGFKPSELQANSKNPAQIIVCHPFNPVYLLPLVEVVASPVNHADFCQQAQNILIQIGMKPLLVQKEIDAHIADRLLEAVWRESLWLVKDGIATTEEIDDAIRFGFGLRWAQMGLFETYRIAGGEMGMKHFIAQFGPALQWNWTKLMDVPELTDALIDKISEQSDAQSGQFSIRELERIRDDNLIGIMRALKKNKQAVGVTIFDHEKKLLAQQTKHTNDTQNLPLTVKRLIPASWVDNNGHMNEAHYSEIFSQANDKMMMLIGANNAYIKAGNSYFTIETHITYLHETLIDDAVHIHSRLINGTGKKLHLLHLLYRHDGILLATGECFLLHVDLQNRKSSLPSDAIANTLEQMAVHHKMIAMPENITLKCGVKD